MKTNHGINTTRSKFFRCTNSKKLRTTTKTYKLPKPNQPRQPQHSTKTKHRPTNTTRQKTKQDTTTRPNQRQHSHNRHRNDIPTIRKYIHQPANKHLSVRFRHLLRNIRNTNHT